MCVFVRERESEREREREGEKERERKDDRAVRVLSLTHRPRTNLASVKDDLLSLVTTGPDPPPNLEFCNYRLV